jgi:hypothetical protein
MSDGIKINVMEVEPGWAFVYFKGGKPLPAERQQWLERALRDWTASHPGYSLVKMMPVEQGGELLALHAWFQISPKAERTIAFDVSEAVLRVHPQEYIEAVMDDVGSHLGMASLPPGRLAIVNRRGVAIVVNASRNHGRMMLADELEPQLDGQSFAELRIWRADPKTTHCVVAMPYE